MFDQIYSYTSVKPDGFSCPTCRGWVGYGLQTKDFECELENYVLTSAGTWLMPRVKDVEPQRVRFTGTIDTITSCENCRLFIDFDIIMVEGVAMEAHRRTVTPMHDHPRDP
jgi:hypothetical protein